MWQDIVLTVGSIVFIINLLPSLFNKKTYIPISSSLPTGVVVFVFAYTQYTLHLHFAAVTQSIVGIMWFLLAYFRSKEKV